MTTQTPDPSSLNETDPSQDEFPKDSYVKLAMRNMVKKSSKSLFHFALTSVALMGVLVGLAYLTH